MQDALHMPEEVVKQKCALMVQIIMFWSSSGTFGLNSSMIKLQIEVSTKWNLLKNAFTFIN